MLVITKYFLISYIKYVEIPQYCLWGGLQRQINNLIKSNRRRKMYYIMSGPMVSEINLDKIKKDSTNQCVNQKSHPYYVTLQREHNILSSQSTFSNDFQQDSMSVTLILVRCHTDAFIYLTTPRLSVNTMRNIIYPKRQYQAQINLMNV